MSTGELPEKVTRLPKSVPGPTGGEWRLHGPNFYWAENPCFMTGYDLYSGKLWLAEIQGEHLGVPREECEANARLFVASREVLKALKGLRYFCSQYLYAEYICAGALRDEIDRVDAVIAKAEGRDA